MNMQEETKDNPLAHIVLREQKTFEDRMDLLTFWKTSYPNVYPEAEVTRLERFINKLDEEENRK